MAKQLAGERMLRLKWDGTAYTPVFTAYPAPTDTADGTIEYKRLGEDETTRPLTAGELSGSVQSLLDGCDTTYEATESI